MFESGSWTHGTSIKAKSDVDYMAVATGTRPRWPSSALEAAKTAVKGCDWKINDVRVSSPVIGITYYTQPDFEVAPAWFNKRISGFDVYWIAGRGDEWVLSAPGAHLVYVNQQNDRLSKKVKPLVRLLKAWKHHVGAPVSSFYLEMRTAEYAAGETSIIYDIDLRRVFNSIVAAGARDMNDPAHIVGRIPACASDEKRRRTVGMLSAALSNLRAADEAMSAGDRSAYWVAMRNVFGTDYPWPTW
jgi:Second Messenger Oligonucleotide or Dinucleotide Synthetase domain